MWTPGRLDKLGIWICCILASYFDEKTSISFQLLPVCFFLPVQVLKIGYSVALFAQLNARVMDFSSQTCSEGLMHCFVFLIVKTAIWTCNAGADSPFS
jgi:hypothetical protein